MVILGSQVQTSNELYRLKEIFPSELKGFCLCSLNVLCKRLYTEVLCANARITYCAHVNCDNRTSEEIDGMNDTYDTACIMGTNETNGLPSITTQTCVKAE
eukprot:TRINITY_DN71454_c0_g1_i1.p1 TRINITY_DN71454_c0_g1~~TRINITY_DN71454_c0_g1_i1.p1  ORF type:complete len:101 (+),score=5.99 TRINITY_DN71454_c0_g1_i1:39-341(+)